MPLLANSCSAFSHRPRERCDPERLNGQLYLHHAFHLLRFSLEYPDSSVFIFFSFHILSFKANGLYLNTISVAEHIFLEKIKKY